MNEETALLDEFLKVENKKGKAFDALIISSLSYITFTVIDFSVDIKTFSSKPFDWQLASMILALPIMGIIFHFTGKIIGWIINSFYYLFVTSVFLYAFLNGLIEKKEVLTEIMYSRGLIFLTLSLASTILLFSSRLRKYFRVCTSLFIIMLSISISLAIIVIVTVK